MQTLSELENEPVAFEEEAKRHGRRLLVGVLCALLLTGSVLGGYLYLRKRHERQLQASAAELEIKKKVTRVEVFVDEAVVNGKTTTLSGTVHNISNETLQSVAVELQLRRRAASTVETRSVTPDKADLPPDGKARYVLDIPTQNYVSATFLRVTAGADHGDVAFRAVPGTPRPPMDPPASKTVVVSRPAPKGEEFINTPNTPGRIP
jgi:hypothetical protein